jgi:hypothetical protein
MFDPITSALMASSPPLAGLDLEALPKRLTEAFADIVAARIRVRGASDEQASETLQKTLSEVRRLAAAYEAFVALLPDQENRAASAFVAASAHQVCLLGTRTRTGEAEGSFVDGASIAPEVCAALLYMIAEAHADAIECAKHIIVTDEGTDTERALLDAIKSFTAGRLGEVARLPVPEPADDLEASDRAVDALFRQLLLGIKKLAARLRLRVDLDQGASGVEAATDYFAKVKALSVGVLDDVFGTGDRVVNLFPGPLHLANLLIALERDLVGAALTRVPTPAGIDEDGWWQIIRRMARRRPFLWRNHREAIERGYLERSASQPAAANQHLPN